MHRIRYFFLAILSALIFSFGWFPNGIVAFLFIAFIPLFILENTLAENNAGKKYHLVLFGYTFLTFFIWHLLTVWWIKNASLEGAVVALFVNSIPMAVIYVLSHKAKLSLLRYNRFSFLNKFNFIFLFFWLGYEYLHHRWDLSFPWLVLGNGLASTTTWVQWYSYTGVLGGSLWILLTNIALYGFYIQSTYKNKLVVNAIVIIVLFFLPITFSYLLYKSIASFEEESINVVVVQPNIDPYNEKFVDDYSVQVQKMLALGQTKVDSTTQYLIFPETALTEGMWENQLQKSESILVLQQFLKKYPRLCIITGASTAKFYASAAQASVTARRFLNEDGYYDNFNTAIQLDNSGAIQIYHKSKLVPGVEMMPFPALLKPLESMAIGLGGTIGSLGKQAERINFISHNKKIKIAPVICYESVYGEYVSDYIKNGAQAIAIITNDGWWGNTPGYKQHLKYGALRAIETNRCIARCANTGISCFINERGDISQATNYWEAAVIKGSVNLHYNQTFYVRYGDYIGLIALCFSLLLVFQLLFSAFTNAKKA